MSRRDEEARRYIESSHRSIEAAEKQLLLAAPLLLAAVLTFALREGAPVRGILLPAALLLTAGIVAAYGTLPHLRHQKKWHHTQKEAVGENPESWPTWWLQETEYIPPQEAARASHYLQTHLTPEQMETALTLAEEVETTLRELVETVRALHPKTEAPTDDSRTPTLAEQAHPQQ